MTTYFQIAENEDAGVISSTLPLEITTAGYYNSSNARGAIRFGVDHAEDTQYLDSQEFTSTDVWLHFVHRTGNSQPDGDINWVKWYADTDAVILGLLAYVYVTGQNYSFRVRKFDGTWSDILLCPNDFNVNTTVQTFDIHVVLGNPGSIEVYVNKILVAADNTLNLTWSGVTSIKKVRFQEYEKDIGTAYSYFSEIIGATWCTVGSRLETVTPTADGNYTDFTNGFANIDEVAPDSTYINSGTADQRYSATCATVSALATGEAIENVRIAALALCDTGGGPQNCNIFTRIGSTDYDGSDQGLNATPAPINEDWATNPNTASAWTVSDLNSMEIGIRSRT